MLYFIIIGVSLLASIVGSICGIGGGIVIKPLLDAVGILPVTTISFLSGCTVLSMAVVSLFKSIRWKESITFNLCLATVLSLGSALGGLIGNAAYQHLTLSLADSNAIGAVQAFLLLLLALGTLGYTLNKTKIASKQMAGKPFTFLIGMTLGILSAFLGIGGGPFNLIALFHFYSMRAKEAALYSIYCIAFSQLSNLISFFFQGRVPSFEVEMLLMMSVSGIVGGLIGAKLNRFLHEKHVEQLFIGLTSFIVLINLYNIFKYLQPV